MTSQNTLRNTDQPLIASFPLYPPLELFHSLGLQPIVLWGFENIFQKTENSSKHLQDYACSVAHYLIEFFLSDLGNHIEGIFHYNACDTLRNLPEVILRNLEEKERKVPDFHIHIPMTSLQDDYSESYLKTEINQLIGDLEDAFGTVFSQHDFIKSVKLYEKMRKLYVEVEERVRDDLISFSKLTEAFLESTFQKVEYRIECLERTIEESDKKSASSRKDETVNIILSGILPPSSEVTQMIEDSGFRIVGNDIAFLTRMISKTPKRENWTGPQDYYVDFYKNHIPCPTLLHTSDKRINYLNDLIRQNKAEGIIFLGEKFCEYEFFEFPYLKKVLTQKNIKLLELEFSKEDTSNIDSIRTRIEAFKELF
jgi:benzoyl-CoA reductase/2-hydroxyglutaryl-CoA dehydratase subunit BcrC/BadD/HgdB